MRIALLLAVVAALCGCVWCQAPADPPWTLEHELGVLGTETARLLSVPCSSYAHTFRRDRHSATDLLAAVRVGRVQACSQGASTECGAPAEALDDACDWDGLVGRLQEVLHALCQHAAIHASVGDNMARSAAVKMVTTAVHEEADREARLYTGRGIHEAAAGTPQFPAQLPHPAHVFGASWAHGQQATRREPASKGAPPPQPVPEDNALFPPLLVWPTMADAGYGASAPATQEGRSFVAALERKALTELFRAAGGPSWRRPFRAKWTTSAPHCTWAGVTCMPAPPRGGGAFRDGAAAGETEVGVVSIRLRGAGLSGSLPPALATLQALQLLELADNAELRGTLPAGLLALPRLRVVAVKGCRLGGALPAQLSPSLLWLDVSMNQLGGELPASLGNLSALKVLNVSHNAIVGTLPPPLGAAPALEVLCLANNRLGGTVPPTLFSPPGSDATSPPLRLLDVSFNRLTGSLPGEAIAGHSSLAVLDVSHNTLGGRLPEPPPSARVWACSGNAFTGGLTHSGLSRAALLRYLDVSDNALAGQLPCGALLHLSRLAHLNLSSNAELGGHLPCGSGNATVDEAETEAVFAGAWAHLQVLDISHTALTGSLCPALFHPGAALTHLDVSRNALSGALPSDALAQVTGLAHLDVSHNRLSGTLSPALGGLAGLTWFSVAGNALTGQVPLALTTMPQLRHVDLSSNGALSWNFLPLT